MALLLGWKQRDSPVGEALPAAVTVRTLTAGAVTEQQGQPEGVPQMLAAAANMGHVTCAGKRSVGCSTLKVTQAKGALLA